MSPHSAFGSWKPQQIPVNGRAWDSLCFQFLYLMWSRQQNGKTDFPPNFVAHSSSDKEIVNISRIQISLVQTIFCIIRNKPTVPLWSCRKSPHLVSTYQNSSTLPGFQYLQHFREHLKHLKNFEMNPVRKWGTLIYIPFMSQFIFPEILSSSCSFSIIKNLVMIHSLWEIIISGAFLSNPLNKIKCNFRISSFWSQHYFLFHPNLLPFCMSIIYA